MGIGREGTRPDPAARDQRPIFPSPEGRRTEPSVLHVDMDAFFAAVEVLERPELRGRPVIVGGDGARGVVAACTYEARAYGVRSAMSAGEAKRRCPQAVFLPGRYRLYERYSHRMHEVLQAITPLVEGLSLDEAFLDVGGARRLLGSPTDIATLLRQTLHEQLGLWASVGGATSKQVAKLASEAAKPTPARPVPRPGHGVVIVRSDDTLAFLHPLPVRALFGVGPVAAAKLDRFGLKTVGDIADRPLGQLATLLGESQARHVHHLAWDQDDRPVVPARPAKSVGHEQTYAADLRTHEAVHAQFVRLADAVATRLRKSATAGRTVTTKVRFGDFQTITRSRTLPKATANAAALVRTADETTLDLPVSRGVRLLGISVSNLQPLESEQLDLADSTDEAHLDRTIDAIRARWGDAAVVPGALIGPDGAAVMRRGEQQWGPGATVKSTEGLRSGHNDEKRPSRS